MTSVKKIKVALLALVAALVIAIPTSALALTITINEQNAGHEYGAYQLFTGTATQDKAGNYNGLEAIQWGTAIPEAKRADFVQDLKDNGPSDVKTKLASVDPSTATAAAVAEAMGLLSSNDTKTRDVDGVDDLAIIIEKYATLAAAKATISGDNKYELTDLAAGYYFIKDEKDLVDDEGNSVKDAKTKYMLTVLGANTTINPKSSVPEVNKTVQEDSLATTSQKNEYGKVADYEIGQTIPYRIVGTLPENYGDYKQYWYKFSDHMSDGLTIDMTSVKVWLRDASTPWAGTEDANNITAMFDIALNSETNTLTVASAADTKADGYLKSNNAIAVGKVIVVEYNCVLNSAAEIGLPGNPNDVDLEFSNNPNNEKGGEPEKGKTPRSYCIVFTFELDNTKIDGDSKVPLIGAGFKLKNESGKFYGGVVDGKVVWNDSGVEYFVSTEDETLGELNFVGLDANETYTLIETTIPAGYKKVNDIPVKIVADTDYEAKFEGDPAPILKHVQMNKEAAAEWDKDAEGRAGSGTVAQDIENFSGSDLPSTGGIGTTIFYIVGAALILAAAITLVVRRRNATTA